MGSSRGRATTGGDEAQPARPPGGVVTLLFTDLVGSTELLSRLGDDDAEELRRTHFSLLRQAVSASGGQEVKNVGDGLMVAFASPVEALRCAVAMQRAIEDHNRRHPHRSLRVRVGIHAGEPSREEGDFFGTAVVVASRLCQEADGSQILASSLVADLVGSRGGFAFRPAGRLNLKGLPHPVAAVAVEWRPSTQPDRPAPASRRDAGHPRPRGPKLVGRERELAIFEAELHRAAAGEFRCLLLLGEPGVGKTRLAGEFLARHGRRTIGLTAHAYPFGATTAFGLWAEALERHLRGLEADEVLALCAGFLPDLAQLLRSVAAVSGSVPDHEPPRSRLLEGLAVVLGNLTTRRPVAVLLDDVHLADASSWEALHYLAHSLPDAPLLVILAARPGDLGEQVVGAEVLLGLEQEALVRRLTLTPLDLEAVRELAEAVLHDEAPPTLVGWLGERSGGYPLFALGLLQALLDEGADLSAPKLGSLPEALSDRVRSRLRLLEEPAVAVLELLAVLGRRIELKSLVSLSGRSSDELAAILERLVRSRLVVEEERGRELTYEIAHHLAQEAIYQGIGAARRRGLHRLVGRGLLAAGRLGEAAPHFVRAADVGDPEAVEVLRDAVAQAEGRGAYREALTILGSLVELLPPGDERWRSVVEAMSWEAEWVVDHRADAHALLGIEAMRQMDAVLQPLPDPARRAVVNLRLASFLAWGTGELEEAESACGRARELFQQCGDEPGTLLASHELVWIEGLKGDLAGMEAGARQVREAAEAAGESLVADRAIRTVAWVAMLRGRFDEAEALILQNIAFARSEGNLYRLTASLSTLAFLRSAEGRVNEARALLDEAKSRNPAWRDSTLLEYEIGLHWMEGDFATALARAREALARAGVGVSRRRGLGISYATLSAIEAGDLPEARRYVARARSAYGGRDWGPYSPYADYAQAMLAWTEGDPGASLSQLRGPALKLSEMGVSVLAAPMLVDLGEVAAEAEDVSLSREAASRLEAIARETDRDLYRGLAAMAAAWAGLASGAFEDAAAQARAAVTLLSGLGWRASLGRAHDVLGRAVSSGDRQGAVEAFQAARATFDGCGAEWRGDRTRQAMASLGGRGQRAAAAGLGPGSLTRREREIARLAAQGHTAREIAERLFIGERTVEGHLARLYAKLGVRSKLELARRAPELGL